MCSIRNMEAEMVEHTLLLCPWTAQIWNEPTFELVASVFWCIRKDRNHFIFKKHPLNPHQTMFRADIYQGEVVRSNEVILDSALASISNCDITSANPSEFPTSFPTSTTDITERYNDISHNPYVNSTTGKDKTFRVISPRPKERSIEWA